MNKLTLTTAIGQVDIIDINQLFKYIDIKIVDIQNVVYPTQSNGTIQSYNLKLNNYIRNTIDYRQIELQKKVDVPDFIKTQITNEFIKQRILPILIKTRLLYNVKELNTNRLYDMLTIMMHDGYRDIILFYLSLTSTSKFICAVDTSKLNLYLKIGEMRHCFDKAAYEITSAGELVLTDIKALQFIRYEYNNIYNELANRGIYNNV